MSASLREFGIRQSSVITLMQGGSEDLARSRKAVDDFGVSVSEVDAAQIERANDALSEAGAGVRGLRNRLAVAVAPAIRAHGKCVYRACSRRPTAAAKRSACLSGTSTESAPMPALPSRPSGRAMWRRWWPLGWRRSACRAALVVLRGALIRTGIGALIVGAGELVYQFRAVTATAWGAAIELLGEVAAGVWEGSRRRRPRSALR
jgi:hypothetical protein